MKTETLMDLVQAGSVEEIGNLLELSEKPTVGELSELSEVADYLSVSRLRKLDQRLRYKIYTVQSGEPLQCGEVWWDEHLFAWIKRDWMVNGKPCESSQRLGEATAAYHLRELRDRGYLITLCACCVCCKEDKSAGLLSRVLGDMLSHGYCSKHKQEGF